MIARRALLLAAAAAPIGIARSADPVLIAVVLPGSPAAHAHMLVAFRRGLAQAGLVEGRDVVLSIHFLDGDFSRLPPVAEAVVAARPRMIVTGPNGVSVPISSTVAIRRCTQSNYALGSPRFEEQVAAMLGRRAAPGRGTGSRPRFPRLRISSESFAATCRRNDL